MKKIYITFLFALSPLPLFAANSLEEELEQNDAGDIDTDQVARNHRREIIKLQRDLNARKKPFWEKKSFYINLIGSTIGLVLTLNSIEFQKKLRLKEAQDTIGLIQKCKMQAQRYTQNFHNTTDIGSDEKITYEDYLEDANKYNKERKRLEKALKYEESSQEVVTIKSKTGLGIGIACLLAFVPSLAKELIGYD